MIGGRLSQKVRLAEGAGPEDDEGGPRLQSGAERDNLIGIDAAVWLFVSHFFDELLYHGHTRHTAHEHNLGDIGDGEAGVGERHAARLYGGIHEFPNQILQL